MTNEVDYRDYLPSDGFAGTLIGRAWVPGALTGTVAGPSPVLLCTDGVCDLSGIAPTCAELLASGFSREGLDPCKLIILGGYDEIMANTLTSQRNNEMPYFLSPY